MSEDSVLPLVKRKPKPSLDDIEARAYWLAIEILERPKNEKKIEVKEA